MPKTSTWSTTLKVCRFYVLDKIIIVLIYICRIEGFWLFDTLSCCPRSSIQIIRCHKDDLKKS